MFTLAVIAFDVIVLIWAGLRILKKNREVAYPGTNYLVWGLFMSAFGIFMYGIRSIVLQFEPFETMLKIDSIVYNIGTFVHFSGCVLLVWFVYKGFAPRLFTKITAPPILAALSLVAIGTGFFPHAVRVHQAPLEPIRFMMTSRPWEWHWMNLLFVYSYFLGAAVILGVFLYNALATEGKGKALVFGVLVPLLIFFGIAVGSRPGTLPISSGLSWTIVVIGLILLVLAALISKNRRRIEKAIMYGFGVALLLASAIACLYISPVFARIGYGIGAILTYKAFGMKIE